MKIRPEKITSINRRVRNQLSSVLDVSPQTIDRWIRDNKENGPLTTVLALDTICRETGLSSEELLDSKYTMLAD